MKAALYARVSTSDQTCENQLLELRRYAEARGWSVVEFVDTASGARESRPALDRLMAEARRRRFDVVAVWRLDRFGRNLRHLVLAVEELAGLGIQFTSLGEGIDTGTAAGRLQLHLLAAIAQFERERIVERVRAGLARARRDGVHIGRPRQRLTLRELRRVDGLSVREAGKVLGVPASRVHRERQRLLQNPCVQPEENPLTPGSISVGA